MTLSQEEIERINDNAEKYFNGDTRSAVVAHVYDVGVALMFPGNVPPYANKKQIAALKGQVTKANKKAQAVNETV